MNPLIHLNPWRRLNELEKQVETQNLCILRLIENIGFLSSILKEMTEDQRLLTVCDAVIKLQQDMKATDAIGLLVDQLQGTAPSRDDISGYQ